MTIILERTPLRTLGRRLRRRTRRAPTLTFQLPLPPGTHVGLAHVRGLEAGGPRLLLSNGAQVTARWALPFHYSPREGDVVRVIGRDGRFYVLGVVQGAGRSLVWARDAAVTSGALRLLSDREIRIGARTVSIRTGELRVEAGELWERAESLTRRAVGLAHTVAGQVYRATEGLDSVTGRRIEVIAARANRLLADLVKVG